MACDRRFSWNLDPETDINIYMSYNNPLHPTGVVVYGGVKDSVKGCIMYYVCSLRGTNRVYISEQKTISLNFRLHRLYFDDVLMLPKYYDYDDLGLFSGLRLGTERMTRGKMTSDMVTTDRMTHPIHQGFFLSIFIFS